MAFASLPDRLRAVQATIAERQARGGWTHPVTIVAVTKTHGPDAVRAAAAAGIMAVGENRVQEALAKMPEAADVPVEWHLIGSLQRNKVKLVVGRFALVHSLDRLELAEEFARRIPSGSTQRVLVEVNCGGEAQKAGAEPDALPGLLDALARMPALAVEGLMTMAPFTDDESVQRAAFRRLRALRDEAEQRGHRLPQLSMGMSGDYPVAVEEGATMLRLGTILFGERVQ
jgi:pyridoxal phosphate enzyme (YggS family)